MEHVFKQPMRWELASPTGTFLYCRIPLKEGPVDIWLPRSVTELELSELVIPWCLETLRGQIDFAARAKEFRDREIGGANVIGAYI